MDSKRQNKLLKLAIGRLQNELEKYEKGGDNSFINQKDNSVLNNSARQENPQTFLTEN